MIDKVIRSKRRKRLAVEISATGEVIVKVPLRASNNSINHFIQETLPWIHQQKNRLAAQGELVRGRAFLEGERFLYLGAHYPLVIVPAASEALRLSAVFELSENHQGLARSAFLLWYQCQARALFSERLAFYARLSGFTYRGIKLTQAKTRWGSCNSQGMIYIHWRLIMAPLAVIDYVIVHELAHTAELNHSPAFWAHVERLLPDYRAAKQWLREFGHLLVL